jgi:pyruvate-ferredoxin/flavodoxin oxidoreductase
VGLKLDSGAPKTSVAKFMANETRFSVLKRVAPDRAEALGAQAQAYVKAHYNLYQQLATPPAPASNGHGASAPPVAVPAPVQPPTPAQS